MADKTGIGWTNATWNPLVGCSIVSPGCKNCYAMKQANRIERMSAGSGRETHYAGTTRLVKGKAVWTGAMKKSPEHILTQPLRWPAPRMIFTNSMSDLFHEFVPDSWIDEIFAVMALAPRHTFQVLTKRAERMRDYLTAPGLRDRIIAEMYRLMEGRRIIGFTAISLPLPNVWLGVSTEDQDRANQRVPLLLDTPAAVRFASYEPAIGPVDFGRILQQEVDPPTHWYLDALEGRIWDDANGDVDAIPDDAKLDWVIVGGESGPGARPFHLNWARDLVRECAESHTALFVKQMGSKPIDTSDLGTFPVAFKHGKGEDATEWPASLRVQEFPARPA